MDEIEKEYNEVENDIAERGESFDVEKRDSDENNINATDSNEKVPDICEEKGTVFADDKVSVFGEEKGSIVAETSIAGSLEIKKKGNKKDNVVKSKAKKKHTNSMADEVKKVEEKLKMREMIRLTVLSVEVSNLPSVHRFTKNLPWLQGAYGKSYSWVADYTESGTGDKASWGDLQWGFNIERNIADRSDFVVTICSQKLIIGRYVLNREEFVNIPDTRSGFFEVKGSILNGAGLAGNIKLVIQKGVADRPSGPPKKLDSPIAVTTPQRIRSSSLSSIGNASNDSPIKNSSPSNLNEASISNDPSTIKFIFVKVISIAVIEMKAVHLLESNSPGITAECGKWVGVSDVVKGAGSAVRWSSLNWKFSVKNDENILANVASNSKLIGNASISMAEIVEAQLKPNGMKEVVKHINNGKEITGKIKFNFVVKVPEDTLFTRSTASLMNHGNDNGEYAEEKGDVQLSHRTKSLDSNDSHHRHGIVNDREDVHSLAQRSTTIPSNHSLSAERLKIRPPFVVRVSDLTVLDSLPMHLLTKNSLSVNVACGAWGSVTEVCPHPGQYAHFMSLNWKVPVMEGSNFRIHVWSRGVCVGACALSLKELLEMPTDVEGKTEIFAKILNEKKEITGKVKLACRYEPYVKESGSKKPAPAPATPISLAATQQAVPPTAPMSATFPESSQHSSSHRMSSSLKSPLKPGLIKDNVSTTANMSEQREKQYTPARVATSPPPYSKSTADAVTLPVKAVVKSISVFDLHSVHMLRRNAPQVLFKVDRKESLTPVSSASGSGSTAKWTELNWAMKISDDSIIYAMVTSGGVSIGRVDLNPSDLVSIPVNPDKLTELSTQLENNGAITGKIQILMQLQPYDDFDKPDEIEPIDYMFGDEQPLGSRSLSPEPEQRVTKKGYQPTRSITEKSPIFDANMLTSAQAVKMGISFNMCIQEIDVMDLKNVHPLTKNYPFVALACGKWNETTSISNTGQSAFWTDLNWKFPIKPSALLRVIVSSKNVIIGSTAINIDQLLQSKTDKEGLKKVITVITNNLNGFEKASKKSDASSGNTTGKVKIAFTLGIVHEEPISSGASVGGISTTSQSRLVAATSTPAAGPTVDTPFATGGVFPSTHASEASVNVTNTDQKELPRSASAPHIPTNINLNGLFNNKHTDSTPLNTLKSLPISSAKGSNVDYYDNNYGSLVDMYGGEHLKKVSNHTPQPVHDSRKSDRNSHPTSMEVQNNSVLNTASVASTTQRSDRFNRPVQVEATSAPPMGSSVELNTASFVSQRKSDSYVIQQNNASMYESQAQQSYVEDSATFARSAQYNDNLQGPQHSQSQVLSQLQQQYVNMTSDRSLHSGTDRKVNKFSTPGEYETDYDQRLEDEQESYVAAMVAESPLFNVTVLEISTVELKSVHKFSKNAPYVKLFCENYQQVTKPNTDGTEICFWKSLSWTFPITDNSVLRLAVFSNSTEIGSVSVPGESIKFLPRDRRGIREIILSLANSSSMASGKIRVKLKASMAQETELFQSQSYKYSNHLNSTTGSGYHSQQRSVSQPTSANRQLQQQYQQQQYQQQQHLPDIRSAAPNAFATPNNSTSLGDNALFTQSHGRSNGSHPPLQSNLNNSGGRTLIGANMSHNISGVSLLSGVVSKNSWGSGAFARDNGAAMMLGTNQAFNGSGQFKMSSGTPSGQAPTVPLLAIPIQQNNTSGGHHYIHKYGDMPPAALNSGGLMSSSVLSGSNYNSLGIGTADNVQGSVKIQIKGIAVIDLPSVHTFSSNSPTVTIACGKFTAQTEEKEKAGQHASWENLDITFLFEKKSQLRVLISSSQVDIGHCNILRSKILSAKKGHKGYLTLFSDLEKDSGKNAGKIKIMYNLYLPNY